ncbi:MAG: hypothetical protein HKN03_01460 [Acidimicrobiales bacterium]|nr:hypothetical protein [Acidimicrobiales bacterium]
MKKVLFSAGVVVLLMLASVMPVSAGHQQMGPEVPIKGTVLGFHEVDGVVAPGGVWQFFSSGEGQMSHLGRVEYSLQQTSSFDANFTVISSGTTTFTAANRDSLVIAHDVESVIVGNFDGFIIEGTWIVVDGSGRFANATGHGTIDAVGDIPDSDVTMFGLAEGTAKFTLNGKISYNASDRSE